MAGLNQLKRRLRSVQTTEQLTSAMQTAASVKYSRLTREIGAYKRYADACRELGAFCGGSLTAEMPKPEADAPQCLVILSGNRGLCGNFNSELLAYAQDAIDHMEKPVLAACGRKGIAYFHGKDIPLEREAVLPDVPSTEDCAELFEAVRALYFEGRVSGVSFIFKHYVNALTQTPVTRRILPFDPGKGRGDPGEMIFEPDFATACEKLLDTLIVTEMFSCVLESALSAQAATLAAMRTASGNARKNAEQLEITINKKRQSDVTNSVIETSSEMLMESEEP